jgi:hypothetical protein
MTCSLLEVIYFLRTKKCARFGGIVLHSYTQPDPKQGVKIFLRHFPTTLVPSLTLQISDIVKSSLNSSTLEFFAYHLPYSRSRCLVTWQREVKLCKVSDSTRVVGKSTYHVSPIFRRGKQSNLQSICQERLNYTIYSTFILYM